jgi:predicted RNA-binding protein with TRAM domain
LPYSRYDRQWSQGEKPVNEGETYDIEIEATGTKGDGIGKIKGFVVIVPGTKPGQKVKVKIDAVRGKVAFGTAAGVSTTKKPAKEKAEGEEAEEGQKEEAEEEAAEEAEGAEEEEKSEESEEPEEEKSAEDEEAEEEEAEGEAEEGEAEEKAEEEAEEEATEEEA